MAEQSTFDRVMASMGKQPESALANIFAAYSAGKMPPADAAQFEKDVRDGHIMLPRGAVLKGSTPGATAPAPAPAGVIAAYNDGRMSPEDKAAFDQDVRDGKWSLSANLGVSNGSIGARIPGTPQMGAAPTAEPGMIDKAIGTGEAALSTATGMTGGTLGMIGGTLKGLAEQILSGQFGTQQAADLVEKSAAEGAQALTYAPRTQSGQDQTAVVGEAMQQMLPVAGVAGALPRMVAPGAGPAGVLAKAGSQGIARDVAGGAARVADFVAPGVVDAVKVGDAAAGATAAATNAAGSAAARVAALAKGATTLPRRALEALQGDKAPTPGTMGSVGAAGTDMATMRRATANDFPIPLGDKLTKGMASRDPAQLKFEVETAKNPEIGAPLRQRVNDINQGILENFDHWADQTGAQAPTLRATGSAVDAPLVAMAKRDKTEVNARYTKADASEESRALVDPSKPVAIGEGETALKASPIEFLNSKPTGLQTTGLLDYAKQAAVKLGIAEMRDGQLVAKPTTIKTMEEWRKEIGGAAGYEKPDIRNATILKALIDAQTEPVAGPLYRQARAARTRYAQKYEDHSVIAKLLNEKRGTSDRQVALEDVHKHAILDGSLDDVRVVRRVLQTGGEQGQQAWKELQGATLRHIREESTKSVALDGSGNRVISPAALDKTIRSLDQDGKLDFIFGKKGAQQLRDIRELAQLAKTAPPEAAINYANTAATLLFAAADVAVSGISGIPAPIATVARLGAKHIKDAGLRKRINEALNEQASKQAPGRSRFKATPIDPTEGGSAPPSTIH